MEVSRFSLVGEVDYTDPKFYEVMSDIVYGALGSTEVCTLDLSGVTLLTYEAAFLMTGYLTLRDHSRRAAYHVVVIGANKRTKQVLDRAAERFGVVLVYLVDGDLTISWPGYRLSGEQETLRKLKEIGESSTTELAEALGRKGSRTAISMMLSKLKELGLVDIRSARSEGVGRSTVMYRAFEMPEGLTA